MGKGIHAIKICRLFNQDSNIFFVKTLKKIFFKEKVFYGKFVSRLQNNNY